MCTTPLFALSSKNGRLTVWMNALSCRSPMEHILSCRPPMPPFRGCCLAIFPPDLFACSHDSKKALTLVFRTAKWEAVFWLVQTWIGNRTPMTHDFAKNIPIDRDKLRDRLRKMSKEELRDFGKACAHMCSLKANFGKPPGEDFAIQLEEARKEWGRRMKRPKEH